MLTLWKSKMGAKIHHIFHPRQNAKEQKAPVGMTTFDGLVSPRQGYYFYCDYFTIDHCYASVLTFFHKPGANRLTPFPPMWGVLLLPMKRFKKHNVSVHLIIGASRMKTAWAKGKLQSVNKMTKHQSNNAAQNNQTLSKWKASYRQHDMNVISGDILDGDLYYKLDFKLLVKAPTLPELDDAVDVLNRWYRSTTYAGMYLQPFDGEQYGELSRLFNGGVAQVGHNYGMTSSELAGMYNLVSHGVADKYGDFVGKMVKDLNPAAIVWDMDQFNDHVIIGADQVAASANVHEHYPNTTRGGAMWAAKLTEQALANNHRVVHLVLDNTDYHKLGADLSDDTAYIPMNKGAINPFEMFGTRKEQLTSLAQNTEKLRMMAHEINPELNSEDLGTPFTKLINEYYRDKGMLTLDAKDHPIDLRLVEIPHDQYPLLEDFCVYLKHDIHHYSKKKDTYRVKSLTKLDTAFGRMHTAANDELFDKYSSSVIDAASHKRQIIYDFSRLIKRGRPIKMAQLINAMTLVMSSLQQDDLLVIDGAENIDGNLKERYSVESFMQEMLEQLRLDNVRVAFVYDSLRSMLTEDSAQFNRFDDANWVLTGYMSKNQIKAYGRLMGTALPDGIQINISKPDPMLYFLRRSGRNVLFRAAPTLSSH